MIHDVTPEPSRRAAPRRRPSSIRLFAAGAALVMWAGCASAPPRLAGDESARFEALRAEFEKGEYDAVVLRLQEFLGDHPGSRYADEAIFLLGRAYYEEGNFPEAEDRFRRILTDYPDSPFAADASYHLALALLSQSRGPQLDQTETLSALVQFQSFLARYPKSPLGERARGHIADIRARLGEKQYLTGELYYRLGAQSAARFYLEKKVLVEYGDTPAAPKAMLKLAESYRKSGDWSQVAAWAQRLEQEHPGSTEAAAAAELLAEARRHGAEVPAAAAAPAAGGAHPPRS